MTRFQKMLKKPANTDDDRSTRSQPCSSFDLPSTVASAATVCRLLRWPSLAQHPSIQAARQRVSAEVNRIPQARALPDPMFNNTFFPSQDQSIQTAAGRVGNQMALSQAIPWPEKLRTKAAIVNQEVQIAQAEVNRIEREITESVRLAYYEVWFATRAAAIINETKGLVDDLTKVAEARYRSGGTQQDVLRAQLESDRLDDQLVSLGKAKASCPGRPCCPRATTCHVAR